MTYQWYFNGSTFSGATTNTLSLTSARSVDTGDYTVGVTGEYGKVTSAKATLTIVAVASTPSASSGGGGGSIKDWSALVLLALVGLRGAARTKRASGA